MSANPQVPFGPPATRDITVRRTERGNWVVGCSDCWSFVLRDTWPAAIEYANVHAIDYHDDERAS